MYVKRDSGRQIIAVSIAQEAGFEEQLSADDAELQAFLQVTGDETGRSGQAQRLRSSDVELARVLEDIVDLLTDKGIIQFTELPEAARQKLLQRKSLRQHIQRLDLLDESENEDEDMMP
jgi:hypothetical protein